MEHKDLVERIIAIEDKMALRELTDSFLSASDKKDSLGQASHFTENGTLTSIMGDITLTFSGRKEIADGFTQILHPLTTVLHLAGQHSTAINGNEATGSSYCYVTLIGSENDKRFERNIWAVYTDEYLKENGKWLINKRVATIAWEEIKELN